MNSSEPLTLVAIESLRAIARTPGGTRPEALASATQRLELLNAILLRDQDVASAHQQLRRRMARGPTRL
jgi:hypothetical protein